MDTEAVDEGEQAAGPRSLLTRDRWTLVAFTILLVALVPVFLALGRREWFQNDDWDYIVLRRAGNLGDLFRPHNGHWETIPVLVYRALWSQFGMRYRAYELVSIVATFAGAALLLLVMLRARTRPLIALMAATLLVFFGEAQTNVAVRITSITFVGFALPLGLLHLMLADHDGPLDRRDWLGLTAGLVALMCSSVAIAMLLVVGIAVTVRRGWRIAFVHVGPPAIVFAVWFLTLGRKDPAPGDPTHLRPLPKTLHFAWVLVTVTFESITRTPGGIGVALVAALVIGLVLVLRHAGPDLRTRAAVPIALLLGAFAFALETGLGRADLVDHGHQVMRVGHYMYAVAFLALPAVALLISEVVRRWRVAVLPVLALFLVIVPLNLHTFASTENARGRREALFRNTMLSIPRLHFAHTLPRQLQPFNGTASPVTIGWLLDTLRDGNMPKPHATRGNAAVATMRASLLLASSGQTSCRPFTEGIARLLPTGGSQRFRGAGIRVDYLRDGKGVAATSYTTQGNLTGEYRITNFGPPLALLFSPVPTPGPPPLVCTGRAPRR